jgi:hypothetical protein
MDAEKRIGSSLNSQAPAESQAVYDAARLVIGDCPEPVLTEVAANYRYYVWLCRKQRLEPLPPERAFAWVQTQERKAAARLGRTLEFSRVANFYLAWLCANYALKDGKQRRQLERERR